MRVLHAPTLGWRNVDLREALAAATGLPVQIENSGRACALAQMWALRGGPRARRRRPGVRQRLGRRRRRRDHERRGAARPAQHRRRVRPRAALARRAALLVRRRTAAGKPTSPTARRWRATSAARSRPTGPQDADAPRTSPIEDLIARARGGDAKAVAALEATARYLGLGLASVINALDPARVYVGGEITLAWDLIEGAVRAALAERALTPAAAETEIRPVAGHRISAPAGRRRAGRGAGVRRAGRGLITQMETMSMTTETLAPTTCIVRDTAAPQGPDARPSAPGQTATRHLHYGRIILDAGDAPFAFATGERETGLICLRGSADGRPSTARRTRSAATTRSTCRATAPIDDQRRAPTAATSPRSPRRSSRRHPVQFVRFADVQTGLRRCTSRPAARPRSATSTC